jgi:hypothetical protein
MAGAEQARAGRLGQAEAQEARAKYSALGRLGQIQDLEEQYPGRRAGGTGPTGILPSGTAGYVPRGYMTMLAEQREKADLEAALSGQESPTVRVIPGVSPIGGQTQDSTPRPLSLSQPAGATGSDWETVQAMRQMIAATETAEANARGTAAEARTAARAAQSPYEREQEAATANQFRRRKGVVEEIGGPKQVPGVRRFSTAPGSVEFEQAAEAWKDPNREAAFNLAREEALTGQGGNMSAGAQIALIQQETMRMKNEAQRTLQGLKDRAAMARVLAEQGGATGRSQAQIYANNIIAQAKSMVDLIQARTQAQRYPGGFGFGMSEEMQQELAEAQELIRSMTQLATPMSPAHTPASGGGAVPPDVAAALAGKPDGDYDLSNGEVWRVEKGKPVKVQ